MATAKKFNVRHGLSAGTGTELKDVIDNLGKVIDVGSLSDLTTSAKTNAVAAINELQDEIDTLGLIRETSEPNGIPDRAQSVISFDGVTRTFTIAPAPGYSGFDVWTKATKRTYTSAQSVSIGASPATGLYYIYFDPNGALSYRTSYFDWENDAMVAYVYWNATTSSASFVADERHGIVLDWQTHEYLHRTRGAVIANGFSISNYTDTGTGANDSDAQFDLSGGTFFDEDLEVVITHSNTPSANTWQQDLQGPARIPVFYHDGNGWVLDTPTDYAVKQGTSRVKYNLFNGTTWSTPDVSTDTHYTTSWIIGTNNINYPVIAIMGQTEHNKISDEEALTFGDLLLDGFPVVEFRPLWKIIWQTDSTYANVPNARIAGVYDIRQLSSGGGISGTTPVSDHGLLTGLGDDDHLQYLHVTETRTGVTAEFNTTGKITTTNKIGIGTTSPLDTLDIRVPTAIGRFEATGGSTPAFQSYRNSGGSLFVGVDNSTGSNFASLPYSATIWHTEARSLVFGTNNTTRGVIDSNGNVGIGTTNPGTKIHVEGDSYFSSTMSIGMVIDIVPYNTLNSGTLSFEGSAGQLFSITNNLTSGSIFSVNDVSGLPSLDINADGTISLATYGGNVGIGTTNPVQKLDVRGNIYNVSPNWIGYSDYTNLKFSDNFVELRATSTSVNGVSLLVDGSTKDLLARVFTSGSFVNYKIWHEGNDGIGSTLNADLLDGQHGAYYLDTSASTQTKSGGLNVSGNVGIGTTNPTQKLHVIGNFLATGASSEFSGSALTITGSSNAVKTFYISRYGVDTGSFHYLRAANSYFELASANNESIALTGGNVGVGVTSPGSKLAVNGYITESTDNGANYWNVVTQQDVGTSPNQVPLNQYLGQLAFLDDFSPNGLRPEGASTDSVVVFPSGVTSFYSTSDYQIILDGNGTDWAGILFTDSNGSDTLWFNGQHGTFSLGGGGANVAGKKLHVDGGVSIGVDSDSTAVPTDGLYVEGNIQTAGALHGPANFVIDPAAVGDDTGTVEIKGNLTVQGTTTTINSTTVDLDNLALGDNEKFLIGDGGTGDNNVAGKDLEIYSDGSNIYFDSPYIYTGDAAVSPNIYFRTSAVTTLDTNALSILASGNVGIGTANPESRFHLWSGEAKINARSKANTGTTLVLSTTDASNRMELLFGHTDSSYWRIQSVEQGIAYRPLVFQNDGGNVGIGITTPDTKLDVNGTIRGERYVGRSTLVLNSYATVNPSSNVFLYSQPNDRDSWIYLDSADTGSNWGIYHRQIDSEVLELPGNSIGFVGGGNSALKAYISLQSGNGYFSGNVGIGTHAPQHKFHIYGPSNDAVELLTIEATSVSSTPYTWGSTLIAPQNAGQALIHIVGQELSQKNSGYFGFVYEEAGSNNNYVTIGGYASDRLLNIKMDGNVGIGITNPGYKLEVNGSFAATTKSFVIDHPTKEGYKLRYGSLEGPENGVYVRGKSKDSVIELPEYWVKLIDPDSITVNLTPFGKPGSIWVERIEDNKIYIGREADSLEYFYMVLAERADVDKLEVEVPEVAEEVTP